MGDFNSMNREMKKEQLRRQIVSNPQDRKSFARPDPDEESYRPQPKGKRRRKYLALFIFLALLLAVGSGLFYYFKYYYAYGEYKVVWQQPVVAGTQEVLAESSFVSYIEFGGNMVRYTKDGAAYIDAKGKTIWVQSYEMQSPAAVVNGDYIAIADISGNSIYICDKEGHKGTATTLLPILKASVSAKGVVGVILEDARANYITFFKRDGSSIDITVKTILSGQGYPLDLSLSPDGTQLICSYIYMNNGMLDCRVVVYNFSEIGKNASALRLVGGFEENFSGTFVPRVQFLDETYSFACSDQALTFFSSKNLAVPQPIVQVGIDSEIRSLFYAGQYVGIIAANESGTEPYRMEVYRANGTLVFQKEFAFPYKHAAVSGDHVLLWNEKEFEIYNMKGTRKFHGGLDFEILRISKGKKPQSYIVAGFQEMAEISLK